MHAPSRLGRLPRRRPLAALLTGATCLGLMMAGGPALGSSTQPHSRAMAAPGALPADNPARGTWRVRSQGPSTWRVTWRSPRRLPVTGARPIVVAATRVGGVPAGGEIGVPTLLADGRTVSVTVPAAAAGWSARSSWRPCRRRTRGWVCRQPWATRSRCSSGHGAATGRARRSTKTAWDTGGLDASCSAPGGGSPAHQVRARLLGRAPPGRAVPGRRGAATGGRQSRASRVAHIAVRRRDPRGLLAGHGLVRRSHRASPGTGARHSAARASLKADEGRMTAAAFSSSGR
jgi:hypothetical protein